MNICIYNNTIYIYHIYVLENSTGLLSIEAKTQKKNNSVNPKPQNASNQPLRARIREFFLTAMMDEASHRQKVDPYGPPFKDTGGGGYQMGPSSTNKYMVKEETYVKL